MKLFVGNLPYSTTQSDLESIFSEFGNVISATVIVDKMSGRSRGFGFVEIEDADAEKAIAEVNSREVGEGLFDPSSKEPFKVSRSKLELFIECPRCFYLDRRLVVGRPPGYSFSLNSAVDALLKKEFDFHRAKQTPHPPHKCDYCRYCQAVSSAQ